MNDYEKAIQKTKEAQQRAFERKKAKINDPAYREKQIVMAQKMAERQASKQKAKMSDPSFREAQLKKKIEQQQRAIERQKAKSTTKPKKTKSKGLKGRTPTAEERRIMDKIGALPCLACLLHGRINYRISLHHLDGRVKPLAHAMVLPLCEHHHDTPVEKQIVQIYPDLVPYHAKGSLGGKAQWRAKNGDEWEMLSVAFRLAELEPPFPILDVVSPELLKLLAA